MQEKNKKFKTLEEKAVAFLEIKNLLNTLHLKNDIKMKIEKAPLPSVLAWFDQRDEEIYITSDLTIWTTELLYILPLHEFVHKICYGIIENYKDGYHNLAFRKIFENITGMTTYHDEKVGWQFVEKTGPRYTIWLQQNRETLNKIFDLINKIDLPQAKTPQDQDGQDQDKTTIKKMNKALKANQEAPENQDNDKAGPSQDQDGQSQDQDQGNDQDQAKAKKHQKAGTKRFVL